MSLVNLLALAAMTGAGAYTGYQSRTRSPTEYGGGSEAGGGGAEDLEEWLAQLGSRGDPEALRAFLFSRSRRSPGPLDFTPEDWLSMMNRSQSGKPGDQVSAQITRRWMQRQYPELALYMR